MLAPGYLPRFIPARIGDEEVGVLTFVADHDVPDIRPDLTHADQVRYVAHGAGDLGTSRDYLASIVAHLGELGIVDQTCTDLLNAELCLNLGDAHFQAARLSASKLTSTPSLTLIPSMTFGN